MITLSNDNHAMDRWMTHEVTI